jgi:LPS export ABC transporter permease LptF/LPS export ABC transporter permease LptG
MLRPRRLTRYILFELGVATFAGIGLWTVILMMNDFFFIARLAIQKDLGMTTMLQMVVLEIPSFLVLAIPIGTLLGSLIAIGRLSADGEIVALQASGLGPFDLIRPMALHGLVALCGALSIYVFVQPWASYELRGMKGRILTARNLSTEIKPRVFFDALPGYVLFVDEIAPGTQGVLQRTLLYQAPESGRNGSEQLILAKHATIGPVVDREGRLRIVFKDGVADSFRSGDPDSYRSVQFDSYAPGPIVLPPWMQASDQRPDKVVSDMTPKELLREYRAARVDLESPLRAYRLRAAEAEAYRRLALPFASLAFALLALPLGVSRVRSGKGAGFALSLGIVLAYWLVFTVGLEQARDGRVPVAVGVWGANILVLIWVIVSYALMRSPSRTPWWAVLLGRGSAALTAFVNALPRGHKAERTATATSTPAAPRRGFRFSSVLDRYIGTLYLRMLSLALASTYLIFSLVELKGLIDAVVERKQPAILVIRYFKYFIPGALVLTLPFAAMIAAVLAVTLLSRHGELTAFKASGMSVRRICLPILFITVLLCSIVQLIQDRIAPETNRRAQAVKDQIQGRNPRTYGWSPGGRWTFGGGGRLYHYRLFDSQSLRFQGLSVFRVDLAAARVLEQWFCVSAKWNGHAWEAEKGWYRAFPEPGSAGDYRRFDREEISVFDLPENFTRQERTLLAGNDMPDQSSIGDLDAQIEGLAKSGYDTTRLRVEYWQKTAAVATPLVTVLLGLPFAFKVGRRGSMYGVGVGLGLAIVFWATAAIFNALGLETILPPLLAAWSPNVVFAAVGVYLLLYAPT